MRWIPSKGKSESSVSNRKVPYTPKQRVKEDMPEAQKEGIYRWNMMVDTLKEHGLMEEK